jgi:hypothetical protein
MKSLIAGFAFLLLSSFEFSGSGTAYLRCKSESGRTIFYAELQDIDAGLIKAQLTVDGKKVIFNGDDRGYTIFDAGTGVFTIYIDGEKTKDFPNGRFIQFWAIPKSFKDAGSDSHYQKYEFKARIEGTEPRKGEGKFLRIPQVELNCVLEYKNS